MKYFFYILLIYLIYLYLRISTTHFLYRPFFLLLLFRSTSNLSTVFVWKYTTPSYNRHYLKHGCLIFGSKNYLSVQSKPKNIYHFYFSEITFRTSWGRKELSKSFLVHSIKSKESNCRYIVNILNVAEFL